MTDALNDSTEQETKAALASRAKQTHTMDEMRASYKESTRLVHV